MASQWTKEEWKAKFDNYDRNKDGTICKGECKRLIQYLGFNPTDKDVDEFMKGADTNEDEAIDFDEFFEFIQRLEDPTGELIDAFKLHDKNGDGYIDREELKAIFTSGNIAPEEVDDLFKLVDENQDGKIEYKEFVTLFTDMC